MKEKGKLILLDLLLILLILFMFSLFSPDLVVASVYCLVIPYIYFTKRKSSVVYFFTASILSILWSLYARDFYGYNSEFTLLFGLNSFPLFAWATGLYAMGVLFDSIIYYLPSKSVYKNALIICIFYFTLLISVEYIGYHYLNIRNDQTAVYAGLPYLNCLHAPRWMQFSYFAMGPIFLGFSLLLFKFKTLFMDEYDKYIHRSLKP